MELVNNTSNSSNNMVQIKNKHKPKFLQLNNMGTIIRISIILVISARMNSKIRQPLNLVNLSQLFNQLQEKEKDLVSKII